MSFDLMVFDEADVVNAQESRQEWLRTQRERCGTARIRDISSPRLRAWYQDMVQRFPDMNGEPEADPDDPRSAGYSGGDRAIYADFRWSVSSEAYEAGFALAARHGLGFDGVSSPWPNVWVADGASRLTPDDPTWRRPRTKILHQIDADSDQVKTLYEVFSWGREASAEYLFYGEIDVNGVLPDDTGDLSKAVYYAMVSVDFEKDNLNVKSSEIREQRPRAEGTSFCIDDKFNGSPLATMTPRELVAIVGAYQRVPISADASSYRNIRTQEEAVCFSGFRIEEGRITTVEVFGSDSEACLGWLWGRFVTLWEMYQSIPMKHFHGAIRE